MTQQTQKPHEETWTLTIDKHRNAEVMGPSGAVATVNIRSVRDSYGLVPQHARAYEEGRLLAAAPAMARALMAMLHACGIPECTTPVCAAARAALRDAGVLPGVLP